MSPLYEVRAWQENDWWLARVVAASDDADPAPLNSLTQARTLTKIESMARDLIATILDADEGAFEVKVEYVLPEDIGDLLCQAKGARTWLDAAQELWQERSVIAARALTEKGYSLREAATLLGLSHQRVDQLLQGGVEPGQVGTIAFLARCYARSRSGLYGSTSESPEDDAEVILVVRNLSARSERYLQLSEEIRAQFENTIEGLFCEGYHRRPRSSFVPDEKAKRHTEASTGR